MRKLFYTTLLTICLAPLFDGSVFAQSYSGTYTVSRLPGQILDSGIFFKQLNQHTMLAQYATSSGVAGS